MDDGWSGESIVVGIDDTLASRAAMLWAARYARMVAGTLRAVHVVERDVMAPARVMGNVGPSVAGLQPPRIGMLTATVREIYESVSPAPDWSFELILGGAAAELVAISRGASLLVVGTGEHRGIDRLLHGSVSHYCLSHSSCPVTAVPARLWVE